MVMVRAWLSTSIIVSWSRFWEGKQDLGKQFSAVEAAEMLRELRRPPKQPTMLGMSLVQSRFLMEQGLEAGELPEWLPVVEAEAMLPEIQQVVCWLWSLESDGGVGGPDFARVCFRRLYNLVNLFEWNFWKPAETTELADQRLEKDFGRHGG